jgi:hypothetical protein
MNKIFKKILIEIDKLPTVDKKSLLALNTFQLEILSKIQKKKKISSSDILKSHTSYSNAQKYRYLKKLIKKNLCFKKGKFYTN